MPTCPSIPCPSGGTSSIMLASLVDRWPDLVEIVSKPVSIAIVAAGFFGLFVGMLLRGREKSAAAPPSASPETAELKWRHEKLVLVERQRVEKQARLDAFAERLAGGASFPPGEVALRLFVLTERWREARQKVGSDLSRLTAVRERLGQIGIESPRGREIVAACRAMAETQILRLEEVREALRGLGERVVALLENGPNGKLAEVSSAALRRRLLDLKGDFLSLPQGWTTAGDEADQHLRELLATVDEPAIAPVREFLLVDGAVTASLAGGSGLDLAGAAGAAVAAIDRAAAAKRTEAPRLPDTPPPPASPPSACEFGSPDPGFREPSELAVASLRPPKGFHDLTGSSGNGGQGGEGAKTRVLEGAEVERTLVLFCSNDVELWGQTVYRGARCRARTISDFPDWARWISIRRLDTHERVFAPIRTASLRDGKTSDPFGFNGSNELFYGARHLGLFSESCPNEVETRFTYGGWGFGHRAHEIAPEVEQLQAAGWEGREIPADTVFEIVIHEELPSLGQLDRLLEGEVRGLR